MQIIFSVIQIYRDTIIIHIDDINISQYITNAAIRILNNYFNEITLPIDYYTHNYWKYIEINCLRVITAPIFVKVALYIKYYSN